MTEDEPRGAIEFPVDPAQIPGPAGPAQAALKHFETSHLPEDLAKVSMQFRALAHKLVSDLAGPAGELTEELKQALYRLKEAKDWAVGHLVAQRKTRGR